MFWIVLVAGWLTLAPLIAWVLGTAVVLADRATPPAQLDEAIEDEACNPEADAQDAVQPVEAEVEYQPALAATA